MPFIGNQPALSYTSFAKQDFTTSATTSYTLDNPVANENEIALFINFVRQEPTTAYTASGTSLTLTSATSASDDMYCVFLGKAVQTVNPPSGSVGLSQLSATGTKDSTTFLRGDNTFASAGGDNTPAFSAYRNTTQSSISNETYTKVQIDTEDFDTASAYDNSTNYRFTVPTGEGGKYYFTWQVNGQAGDNNLDRIHTVLYKNGSAFIYGNNEDTTSGARPFNHMTHSASAIVDASANDYFEVYVKLWVASGNGNVLGHSTEEKVTRFEGFKLIG